MENIEKIEKRLTEGASPLEIAEFIVSVLDGKKAKNIRLLHVEKQTVIADYFIICSGNSRTQIKSLADEVEYRMTGEGLEPLHVEGGRGDSWILLDYGAVIVHVFGNDTREFYDLEKLYDGTTEQDISSLITED
ncbi:MAG: ribosome silencing factor [Clostridia bacterium]|nr:ribosome silencing factor [Clostridia bacterium]